MEFNLRFTDQDITKLIAFVNQNKDRVFVQKTYFPKCQGQYHPSFTRILLVNNVNVSSYYSTTIWTK